MHQRLPGIVIGLAAASVTAGTASAQIPRGLRPADPVICLTPARECGAFWITEVGYFQRFSDSTTAQEHRHTAFSLEGGAMLNRGSIAVGGGVFYNVHVDGRRWGIRPRIRWWAGRSLAVDVMPGIIVDGWDYRGASNYPGWNAHVGLEWEGLIGAVGGVDVVPRLSGGSHVDWYGGGRVAGRWGLVTGVSAALMIWFIDGLFGNLFGRRPVPTS